MISLFQYLIEFKDFFSCSQAFSFQFLPSFDLIVVEKLSVVKFRLIYPLRFFHILLIHGFCLH